MSHQRAFTHGRRSRVFGIALIAALVWTAVVADPASARHNRSRPFSIVLADRAVPGAPDSFTCRFIEEENDVPVFDYRCSDDAGFQALLIGPDKSDEDAALLVTNATADPETKVISPGRFTCSHRGGTSRLPADFECEDDRDRDFTLRDFAYVTDKKDPGLVYALPCRPCVVAPPA